MPSHHTLTFCRFPYAQSYKSRSENTIRSCAHKQKQSIKRVCFSCLPIHPVLSRQIHLFAIKHVENQAIHA
ncbi:hypothetical protein L2E82_14812 [Cichorium intybus]|uniref:Uncharacterized protein n=1 Tax=Cichorium intybus TaxID=13427 RepID=A0ACB9F1G1_CICIN|nr:hypothetical protein L2E82_14812 [Cichorium intybus]